jgi:hypothetical protein
VAGSKTCGGTHLMSDLITGTHLPSRSTVPCGHAHAPVAGL